MKPKLTCFVFLLRYDENERDQCGAIVPLNSFGTNHCSILCG